MSQNVVCSVKIKYNLSLFSVIYKYNIITFKSQIFKKCYRSCNLLSQENKM
jgi:hypothetical protein